MLPDLVAAVAAEHQKDLHHEAALYRLAAAAVPPTALRQRLGRRFISVGMRISGHTGLLHATSNPIARKEEAEWKPC